MSTLAAGKPYHLIVTFWGKRFREHFYSLCLASLLSPNNIPRLGGIPGCKFIVCTTAEDWNALQGRPLFERLRQHVTPTFIEIGLPEAGQNLQFHMSKGHRLGAREAIRDGAWAGFVAPDLLVSDGMISFALSKAAQGKKAVLTPAIRYAMEPVLKALGSSGLPQADEPLVLQPRYLAGIASGSLHSEVQRYEFDAPYFGDYPIWSYWRVPQDEGFVLHTVSWALLLGDFAAVRHYSDRRLYDSTIDGFYVHDNFYQRERMDDLYLSTDSDEVVFMGLTAEADLTYLPLQPRPINRSPRGFYNRLSDIDLFLHSPEIDEFRRRAYLKPFILHGRADKSRSEAVALNSRRVMEQALSLPWCDRLVRNLLWYEINHGFRDEADFSMFPAKASMQRLLLYFIRRGPRYSASLILASRSWREAERHVLRILFGWMVGPLVSRMSRRDLILTLRRLPRRYRRPVLRRIESNLRFSVLGVGRRGASDDQPAYRRS